MIDALDDSVQWPRAAGLRKKLRFQAKLEKGSDKVRDDIPIAQYPANNPATRFIRIEFRNGKFAKGRRGYFLAGVITAFALSQPLTNIPLPSVVFVAY